MQKNIRNKHGDVFKKKLTFIVKAACVVILIVIGIKYLYDRESIPEQETKGHDSRDSDESLVKDVNTGKNKNETRKNEPAKVTSVPADAKNEKVPDENNGNTPESSKDDPGSSDTDIRLYDENGKLNINAAGKTELMKLNGIGEKRAQDILDYRADNGGFKSIEEIMKVKGIKQGIFSKIKDQIFAG